MLLVMRGEFQPVIFIGIAENKGQLPVLLDKMLFKLIQPAAYTLLYGGDEVFNQHVAGRHTDCHTGSGFCEILCSQCSAQYNRAILEGYHIRGIRQGMIRRLHR
ncbi:hypothetical protein D3C79_789230 [compost metagenome]